MRDHEQTGDFKSVDEDQRRFAIIHASQTADRSHLPMLLELLHHDTEANRRHAVRALANIGGSDCEAELLAMLTSESGLILGDVCRALGTLRVHEAGPGIDQLRSHELDWVRSSALWALGQINHSE